VKKKFSEKIGAGLDKFCKNRLNIGKIKFATIIDFKTHFRSFKVLAGIQIINGQNVDGQKVIFDGTFEFRPNTKSYSTRGLESEKAKK